MSEGTSLGGYVILGRAERVYRWAERQRMQRSEHLAEGIYESDLSKGAWARLVPGVGLADVRVIAAGVYPPYTLPGHERLTWKYASFIRSLDGTDGRRRPGVLLHGDRAKVMCSAGHAQRPRV